MGRDGAIGATKDCIPGIEFEWIIVREKVSTAELERVRALEVVGGGVGTMGRDWSGRRCN